MCEAYLPRRYRLLANAATAVVTKTPSKSQLKEPVVVRSGETPYVQSGLQEESLEELIPPPEVPDENQTTAEEYQTGSTFSWGGTLVRTRRFAITSHCQQAIEC